MKQSRPAYHDAYLAILREELVPAMGCTEPIAVAYAAATARKVLGERPDRAEIRCSANIVKNVKGVTVPNTGGMRGIAAAAVAGIVGGRADASLEVLAFMTDDDRRETARLLREGFCVTTLAEGVEGLYIEAIVGAGDRSAEVVIRSTHTGITRIRKDGKTVFEAPERAGKKAHGECGHAESDCAGCVEEATCFGDAGAGNLGSSRDAYELLNVRDIVAFADTVEIAEIADLMERQIALNEAIADEGLKNDYGASVGKTILARDPGDVRVRARARAAAGSDARMGGCAMPVMINSGSGNQGITASLPVIEYAREMKASHEALLRALLVSNLVALEQKEYIGKLSAYCGAVSAAVGSGAGISYLAGGGYDKIAMTVTTAIATASGMLCDGAKSSCAAKIATAVESAIMAHEMSMQGRTFAAGEGLVADDVEATIRNVGYVGAVGMKSTDVEVIRVMLDGVR